MNSLIHKSVTHSLLLDERHLRFFFDFVKARFDTVVIKAWCRDGTRLRTDDIEEILTFNNPNSRRVWSLAFEGLKTGGQSVEIEITCQEFIAIRPRRNTAEITISLNSDAEAVNIMRELLQQLNDAKTSYDWFVRFRFCYAMGLTGLCMTFRDAWRWSAQPKTLLNDPFSNLPFTYIFNSFVLAIVAITITIIGLEALQSWLFPSVVFYIGRQKEYVKQLASWRLGIFGSIVGAILVGLITNYLYALLSGH